MGCLVSENPRMDEAYTRVLRRSAALRRRDRVRLVTVFTSAAAAVALALALIAPSAQARQRTIVAARLPGAIELTSSLGAYAPSTSPSSDVAEASRSEQDLSVELLRGLVAGRETSPVVSPLSLEIDLAMLDLGAKGQTSQQIRDVMGLGDLSPQDAASAIAVLGSEFLPATSDSSAKGLLSSANALWTQQGLTPTPAFLRQLVIQFGAGVWQADFRDHLPEALAAINSWTSRNTNGQITQLFGKGSGLSTLTRLVLANALFVNLRWQQSFEAQLSTRPFYQSSTSVVHELFMSSPPLGAKGAFKVPAKISTTYEAVSLPYADSGLSALLIMPTTQNIVSYLASLTGTKVAAIAASLAPAEVQVSMPSVSLRSDDSLNGILQGLGVQAAFGRQADFSGLISGVHLEIQSVEQQNYISVGPEGTVVASATGISGLVDALVLRQPIVLDHPYLMLIRNDRTGVILLATVVR